MISTVRDRIHHEHPSWITCLVPIITLSYRVLLGSFFFPSLFDLGERKEIATAGLPFAGHYPVIVSPLLSSPLVSLYYHQGSLSFLFFLSFSGRSR